MAANQDLINFLQRAVGYSLTGEVNERIMFILYGSGSNGKSTLLEVLHALLGEYGRTIDPESLMARRENDTANSDIARLKGARFVSAAETEKNKRLNEAKVKKLTGGDTIVARFLYQREFEFQPEFKMWLATNHKPAIHETTNAIWNRLRLIPFAVSIPDEKQDKHLKAKLLKEEAEGIIAWAVKGCQLWLHHGMMTPELVKVATQEYRDESNPMADFFERYCVIGPRERVSVRELHKAHLEWARETNEWQMRQAEFNRAMRELGYEERRSGPNGNYEWHGIGLKTYDLDSPPPLPPDPPEAVDEEEDHAVAAEALNASELILDNSHYEEPASTTFSDSVQHGSVVQQEPETRPEVVRCAAHPNHKVCSRAGIYEDGTGRKWCDDHQDRGQLFDLGARLNPPYPRLQLSVASFQAAGARSWGNMCESGDSLTINQAIKAVQQFASPE